MSESENNDYVYNFMGLFTYDQGYGDDDYSHVVTTRKIDFIDANTTFAECYIKHNKEIIKFVTVPSKDNIIDEKLKKFLDLEETEVDEILDFWDVVYAKENYKKNTEIKITENLLDFVKEEFLIFMLILFEVYIDTFHGKKYLTLSNKNSYKNIKYFSEYIKQIHDTWKLYRKVVVKVDMKNIFK